MPYPKDTDDWEAIYEEYYREMMEEKFENMKYTYGVGEETSEDRHVFLRAVEAQIRNGLKGETAQIRFLRSLLNAGNHSHQVHIEDLYLEAGKQARGIMIENSVRSARERNIEISESDVERHKDYADDSFAKFQERRERLKILERISLGNFSKETVNKYAKEIDTIDMVKLKNLETLSTKAIPAGAGKKKIESMLRVMF